MATIYGMTVTFGGVSGSTIPQVTVTAPTGSTVTAKKGDVTLTAAEKNGVWVFDLPEFGAWVITATKGTQTATQSVVFEGAKAVNLSFFSATIAVTYPAGSTCTCSNGATVLTAPDTSGTCSFIVTGMGVWTVSATDGESYATTDVEIVNDGQAESVALSYKPTASTTATSGETYTSGLAGLDAETVSLFAEAISNNSAITRSTSAVYIDYGNTHRKISVGDQMSVSLNGTVYMCDIVGFNHDDLSTATAYGDTTVTGKAGITLQTHDAYSSTHQMNSSNTNNGGYDSTAMHRTTLPSIKSTMPSEVQAVIKTVNKLTSEGNRGSNIETIACDLFLLSEIELYGKTTSSKPGEGNQYAYYSAGNTRVKTQNGGGCAWWMRSPHGGDPAVFLFVYFDGGVSVNGASNFLGVSFAFCV